MIAEESPIDLCELRDIGHRIAVEAGVLPRQQDVAGGGRDAQIARENDDHGGLDGGAIESVALEDGDGALEAWLRTTRLCEIVPVDITLRDLRRYHGFLFMVCRAAALTTLRSSSISSGAISASMAFQDSVM